MRIAGLVSEILEAKEGQKPMSGQRNVTHRQRQERWEVRWKRVAAIGSWVDALIRLLQLTVRDRW